MKKILIALAVASMIISGCSNKETGVKGGNLASEVEVIEREPVIGQKKIDRTRPLEEPTWVTSTYKATSQFPEYELFVGISPFTGNERDAVRLAEQDAVQKAITYLGTYGENNLKKVFSTAGVDFVDVAEASEEKVSQISKNFAEGIKSLESYTEWGERYSSKQIWETYVQTYVLYGLEREAYRNAQEEIKESQKEILKEKAIAERNDEKKAALERAIKELDQLTE